MAFATSDELETYMGRTFTVDEVLRAVLLLDVATARIQTFTGQRIERATSTVTVYPTRWSLFLPERPVVAVVSIEYDSVVLDAWELTAGGAIARRTWPGPVVVTYTHGYAPIPDDIKGVCMDMASRGMLNRSSGVRSESNTTGPFTQQVTYSEGSVAVSPDDQMILSRYMAPAFA